MLCDDLNGRNGGGVGERLKKEEIYIYTNTYTHTQSRFKSLYSRKEHNIVKQLYTNVNLFFIEKKDE